MPLSTKINGFISSMLTSPLAFGLHCVGVMVSILHSVVLYLYLQSDVFSMRTGQSCELLR
ncbi:hypothetical protein ASPVEDRAFT_334123 [Aspergillus versicolor CBS 583.65]|uniref:Uncharacterized protein n=1 Tax=Aspergillus versicolor CBS 583.65 TaxID=1036611 RepID=A0A1L9PZ46_ASPVE|nr:uncharacterized protein ASPVEDRAFT_334123 [Aspergillus versicolor CBS 583.65]OJJ06712.1 hypothetical protein ASPVEDRAFT_334123 [Aspergillus versicolor CBS 583.65]